MMSIDVDLQQVFHARAGQATRAGAAVVMDCKTGEVLAMVLHIPSFDPNAFIARPDERRSGRRWSPHPRAPLTNKAIVGPVPSGVDVQDGGGPGGLGDAGDHAERDGSELLRASLRQLRTTARFHCWNRGGHGGMNMIKALRQQSCDVYFYEMAQSESASTGSRHGGTALRHRRDVRRSTCRASVTGLVPTKDWKESATLGLRWKCRRHVGRRHRPGLCELTTPLQNAC